MELVLPGRPIVKGAARGLVLASSEPLSFWGGYDQSTGEIIDRRHPLSGQIGSGRIIAVPFTRGSSTTTGILLESVRAGVGPAGIVTTQTDSFLALAAIVAEVMYARSFPVVVLDYASFVKLESGMEGEIHENGEVVLTNVSEGTGLTGP